MLADRSNVVELGALNETAAQRLPSSFRAYMEEDRRYSTPEMVAIEERMLATARAGHLAGRGLASAADVDHAIASRPTLTGEQQTMIHAVCRRGAAVTLIEGSAGSGKTTALAACREALEASGHQVVGAALSANAAFKLSQEAGIETSTVHSLLHRLDRTPESPDTVLVIDEAAMVGSRQVARLVDHAARDGAKLVLVGDPHQLHAIDGGAAFRALGDQLGSVRMTENVRQADEWERRALADLREGRTAEAVSAYIAHDAVVTGKRLEARYWGSSSTTTETPWSRGGTPSCSPTAAPTSTRSTASPMRRRPRAASSRDPPSPWAASAFARTGRSSCPRSSAPATSRSAWRTTTSAGSPTGCACN